VPSGFGRELCDQESDGDRSDDRHQNDKDSPRARWGEDIGVVTKRELSEEQEIVDKGDQVSEHHRTEPRHDADNQCQDRQKRKADPAHLRIGSRNRELRTAGYRDRPSGRALGMICYHWWLSVLLWLGWRRWIVRPTDL
jgi:hypothetical protein